MALLNYKIVTPGPSGETTYEQFNTSLPHDVAAISELEAEGKTVTQEDPPTHNPSGNGGSQPYVPGTDRFCITTEAIPITPGSPVDPIDWSVGNPYITVIGDAVTLVGGAITFLKAGLYSVQAHLPGALLTGITGMRLAIGLNNEAADGADAGVPGGDTSSKANAATAEYVWAHEAGDIVHAALSSDGAGDPVTVGAICQVVRLSEIAPGNEFASSGRINSLPTSDPHAAGELWLDIATVKVSAG